MIHKWDSKQDIKEELVHLREKLFSEEWNLPLLKALRKHFPAISSAYLLEDIVDQTEDIFHILIDANHIAIIELSKMPNDKGKEVAFDVELVSEYRKSCSFLEKRKLDLACELMSENNG